MWGMLRRTDELVAQPVLKQMRAELLEGGFLQADETPVTVRLEDQKQSKKAYVWVYGWKEKVLFDFTPTRERDGPRRFLGAWQGVLQSDGYSGYDQVTRENGLVRAGCLAHARFLAGYAVRRRCQAWSRSSRCGQLSLIATQILRTVTRTRAPIFRSFSRIVPHCARAISVPVSAMRRSSLSST